MLRRRAVCGQRGLQPLVEVTDARKEPEFPPFPFGPGAPSPQPPPMSCSCRVRAVAFGTQSANRRSGHSSPPARQISKPGKVSASGWRLTSR
jgi:hypothetical protein